MSHRPRPLVALLTFTLLIAGCASSAAKAPPTAIATSAPFTPNAPGMYAPADLRHAYGVDALIRQGWTGKGQTIIDLVCFGSPTAQADLDVYSREYHLPQTTVKIVTPLGATPPPADAAAAQFQASWVGETELDVELYHAIAPDAQITVLEVPTCAAEGIVGLPESRQALQAALSQHLGQIVSVSGGTSEATLQDPASRAELRLWDTLLQTSTTQQGITYLISSGDSGATDYADVNATQLATSPTTSFPTDSPWVTSVGGSSLTFTGNTPHETAWNSGGGASGGGFSAFYSEPDYQKQLLASAQQFAQGRRGVPDVAAVADPRTGARLYINGAWRAHVGGTSMAAPIWAAIIAIANQRAGKPLGFLNPALYRLGLGAHAAQDFADITVGDNHINGLAGFQAAPGWDPVTGWGTPHADQLIPDLIAANAG